MFISEMALVSQFTYWSYSFHSNSMILSYYNLFHAPLITKNILSVSQCCADNNVFFEFHSNSCCVKNQTTKRVLLEGAVDERFYKFNLIKQGFLDNMANQCTQSMFSLSSSFANKAECTKKVFLANCTYEDWHQRLGHPTFNIVSQALSSCNTLFSFNKTEIPNCNACQMYKFHKLPFQSSSTIYSRPLELVVSDLWGPSSTLSCNGFPLLCYICGFLQPFYLDLFSQKKVRTLLVVYALTKLKLNFSSILSF